MRIEEMKYRNLLAEYSRMLLAKGYVLGNFGNLSVRLSGNYILTTPAAVYYDSLNPADITKMDIKTLTTESGANPTLDKAMHAKIYAARPDVGAVIHTHAKFCSIFAAAHVPLSIADKDLSDIAGSVVYVSDYARSGSFKAASNIVKALGDRKACLIANHGVVCVGTDMREAMLVCEAVEEAAKRYIEPRWQSLSSGIVSG